MTLRELITHYVDHRHEVVVRRTRYDLRKAEERAHILEGLTIALDHLDAVISIIRHSDDTEAARNNLVRGLYPSDLTPQVLERLGLPARPPIEADRERRGVRTMLSDDGDRIEMPADQWLSEAQADAILALRLSRLTGLEREKIEKEYESVLAEIERLREILASRELRMQIIKAELLEVKQKHGDARRTTIDYTGGGDINLEDLIEDEQVVVNITHQGLIKRTGSDEYRQQGRGGVGMRGTGMRDEDYIEHLFVSSNHDYLLFFTDHGRCFWLRVYEIPEGSRTTKGRSIRNLIQIAPEDRVRAIINVSKRNFESETFLHNHFVMMATRRGLVKKTPLHAFSRPRMGGIIAISVVEGDQLLEAALTGGNAHVILASSNGRSVRFREQDARPMGRDTQGVRGIALGSREQVVGMVVIEDEECDILAISSNGFGKRSRLEEYRIQARGGKGIITMRATPRTGPLVSIMGVTEHDDLMIVTQNGLMIRMHVRSISVLGRNTQGVRLIHLKEEDAIADVTRVVVEDESGVGLDGIAVDGAPPTDGMDE